MMHFVTRQCNYFVLSRVWNKTDTALMFALDIARPKRLRFQHTDKLVGVDFKKTQANELYKSVEG
jgi:hypothetical protein